MRLVLPDLEPETLEFEYKEHSVTVRLAQHTLEEEVALQNKFAEEKRKSDDVFSLSNLAGVKASLRVAVAEEDIDPLINFLKLLPSAYVPPVIDRISQAQAGVAEKVKKNLNGSAT